MDSIKISNNCNGANLVTTLNEFWLSLQLQRPPKTLTLFRDVFVLFVLLFQIKQDQ